MRNRLLLRTLQVALTCAFAAALSALDNWTFDNCTFDTKVDVIAVDWAFGGIPLPYPLPGTGGCHTGISRKPRTLCWSRNSRGIQVQLSGFEAIAAMP